MTTQESIVPRINEYLKAQNIPLKFDEQGVCNGLASLYAKYVLEGRADEFQDLLKRASNVTAYDEEVNTFINQVLLTMEPELFNKNLNQNNSYQALSVNQKEGDKVTAKSMKACFDISLVGRKKTMANLIKNIKLQENEVMLISTPDHAMGIRKKGDKYYLYDPSSIRKEIKCDDEAAIVNYLSFWYGSSDGLALNIRVINNPHISPRNDFPSLDIFAEDPKCTIKVAGQHYNNLSFFAENSNSAEMMGQIIEVGNWSISEYSDAASKAVINNNHESLKALLPALNGSDLPNLIFQALVYGRRQSYQTLRNWPPFSEKFKDVFKDETMNNSLLAAAANGGNPELLSDFFNELTEFEPQNIITKKLYFDGTEDMIQHAIKSDNPDCVRIMLSKISSIEVPLDTKLSYLIDAIKRNNPSIVNVLIKELNIPRESLSRLNIPMANFEKTDTYLLQILKDNGMQFSEYQERIFEYKTQHKPMGVTLAIGIVLQKFTDYFQGKTLSVEQEEMRIDLSSENRTLP